MNLIRLLSARPWVERLGWTLLHFLWQGALIAALYAVARICLGRTRPPGFRYFLACAGLLAMALAPIVTFGLSAPNESAQSAAMATGTIASPTLTTSPIRFASMTATALRTWRDGAATWIVPAWFLGAVLFWLRLAGCWIMASRMRSLSVRQAPARWQHDLDRLRTRLNLSLPVRLVVSSLVQVPTVVGWLRPVVLVPLGALTGLEPALIEALLAHELAHIRRHDYLVNVLQGVVEALLFYHPAVWLVSGDMRRERELCCDDIAVSLCGDPLTYVRALTELESCRPNHLNPALAANGGSLSDRVARLLGITRPAAPMTMPTPGSAVIAVLVVAALILATQSKAQISVVAASSLPAFETASIKPSDPDSALKIDFAAGGRLFVTHATLRFLMKIAYDISDDQIIGGPAWLNSTRFDIQAKPATATGGDPQSMTQEQILVFHEPIRLRLQRLLADRFQLELRKESKPMPIFALVAAKNGPKMKRDSTPGDAELKTGGGRGILTASRVDMPMLAHFLSEGQVGRPVTDMTGFTGKFDFRLEWTPDPSLNPSAAGASPNQQPPVDPGGISIFTALQQQLGLRLDARTGTADVVVVTRAELPSAN